MLKRVLTGLACFLAFALPALGYAPVRIIRVDVPNHAAVYSLTRELGLDVADAQSDHIIAYADDAMIGRVRARGLAVTVLVDDYQEQAARDLADHYTYAQTCSILVAKAQQFPAIVRYETLGFSAGGRLIPAVRVTENPNVEHPRPRLRINGAHHGNEKQSTEICLSFLDYLTSGYGVNPLVTALVNNRETWIIPIVNPDGHVANRRTNDAGVDLNRDFGYEWENYSTPYSQPESRAMNENARAHMFSHEYCYHTTAAYVNYLMDHTPIDPPDSAWIVTLSQRYADSTYGSPTTRLVIINGYDWYEVHGSCQDNTFGCYGGLSTTIETQLPSTRVRIDSICVANRRALLYQLQATGWGLNGLVYDSATGAPLFARVEVTSPSRWNTYTHAPTGDFHKMVAPGAHSLRVSANGYEPRTIANVIVPDTGGVELDVPLAPAGPDPLNHAQQIYAVKRVDNSHTLTGVPPDALGAPDMRLYRVGPSSSIHLRLDPQVACRNRAGDDITVYATGTYTVAVTNEPAGSWTNLGNGSGTQSFDLGLLDSCRLVRITEQSNCLLDAVGYVGSLPTGQSDEQRLVLGPRLSVGPNPATGPARISYTAPALGRSVLRIADAAGRTVVRLPDVSGAGSVMWDLRDARGRRVPDGVYFVNLESAGRLACAKLAVRR